MKIKITSASKPETIVYTDEVKSDKWRNLYFLKDGRTVLGSSIFKTEKDAELCFISTLDLAELSGGWASNGCITVPFKYFSHAIQMPVKE